MSIPTSATKVVLKNAPTKEVNYEFGQPSSTFDVATEKLPELQDGQILVKILYLSNDPTQRTWMQKDQDLSRAYAPPILPGDAVKSLALAEVVASKSSKAAVGAVVSGRFEWADYAVASEALIFNIVDQSKGLPLPFYLSVLGMTSLTAYFGLTEVGQFKKPAEGEKGPIVAVSAASGATGSMVVKIAKHILGASKVIGISGSDEKCKYVESIGADYCANYHDPEWKEKLTKEIGQDYIDIYFDNVGGDILGFMLSKIKRFGRVVACGAISGYNDRELIKVPNWGEIITNSLTVQGFIVGNYLAKVPEAIAVLADGLTTGKLQVAESFHVEDLSEKEDKFEQIPQVWKLLFGNQKPNGKLITKIA